jgi:hypothetical protein
MFERRNRAFSEGANQIWFHADCEKAALASTHPYVSFSFAKFRVRRFTNILIHRFEPNIYRSVRCFFDDHTVNRSDRRWDVLRYGFLWR